MPGETPNSFGGTNLFNVPKHEVYFMDEADAILRSLGYVILLTGYAPVVAPYPRVF